MIILYGHMNCVCRDYASTVGTESEEKGKSKNITIYSRILSPESVFLVFSKIEMTTSFFENEFSGMTPPCQGRQYFEAERL